MSLSKYYKNSDSFQPETIVKTGAENNSDWKTLIKKHHPEPFQPEVKIQQTKKNIEIPEKKNTIRIKDTAPSPKKQDREPDKYIEISELEKRTKIAYDKGIKKGLEKAEEDYGSAVRSLATLCRQLDTIRETIISNSSREIQEFALAIAERIIRKSLQNNDTTIIATIDEALQRAVKSEEFSIYIHPDDYDTVVKKSDELITGISGLDNIVIKKDITVEKGGAKIESDNCTIDATIAGQFDVILEEIKQRHL